MLVITRHPSDHDMANHCWDCWSLMLRHDNGMATWWGHTDDDGSTSHSSWASSSSASCLSLCFVFCIGISSHVVITPWSSWASNTLNHNHMWSQHKLSHTSYACWAPVERHSEGLSARAAAVERHKRQTPQHVSSMMVMQLMIMLIRDHSLCKRHDEWMTIRRALHRVNHHTRLIQSHHAAAWWRCWWWCITTTSLKHSIHINLSGDGRPLNAAAAACASSRHSEAVESTAAADQTAWCTSPAAWEVRGWLRVRQRCDYWRGKAERCLQLPLLCEVDIDASVAAKTIIINCIS